jgi:hypothetical protein
MNRLSGRMAVCALLGIASALPAEAGGAWAPGPGHGYLYVGFSRKTADSSWTTDGTHRLNANTNGIVSWHDFRYVYLYGEVGVLPNLSVLITPTWLYGLEGPKDDYEKNVGLSDAWFGLKYQVLKGSTPMAVAFNHRNDYFYDLDGAYNRHLFDSRGEFRGVSPEWRGLLKHDWSISYLVSRSLANYRGWGSLEGGYTWREGAPADQVFFNGDVGYPLPFWGALIKGAAHLEVSVGEDSPREPDDRFGASPINNFNKASYLKVGGSAIFPFGGNREWAVELGYNQWVWGRSARKYHEPYISLGRSF